MKEIPFLMTFTKAYQKGDITRSRCTRAGGI